MEATAACPASGPAQRTEGRYDEAIRPFAASVEEPLRRYFDCHLEKLSRMLDGCAARCPDEFATRNAWVVHVFPRLPILLLYWPPDVEFDSQVTIRFDSSADTYFDVGTIDLPGRRAINGHRSISLGPITTTEPIAIVL